VFIKSHPIAPDNMNVIGVSDVIFKMAASYLDRNRNRIVHHFSLRHETNRSRRKKREKKEKVRKHNGPAIL